MSSDPAVVMDFLGLQNAERKSALHSSLSKIKPQMMQQVLSWRGLLEKPKTESGKPDSNKTMGLFPQTTGFGLGHSQPSAYHHGRTLPYLGHSPASNGGNSAPLLTIFYNGAVNVFHVDEGKAREIMTLAESLNSTATHNKNPTTATIPANTVVAEESYASPAADSSNSKSPQIRTDLPIARKHSLQLFLQKRKDRLTSKAPYETAFPSKVAKDRNEEDIAAPECAA